MWNEAIVLYQHSLERLKETPKTLSYGSRYSA